MSGALGAGRLREKVRRRLVDLRDRFDSRTPVRGLPGRSQPSLGPGTLERIEAAIDERNLRRVAIIGNGQPTEIGDALARRYPGAEILVLATSRGKDPLPSHPRPRVTVLRAVTVEAMHDALSELPDLQVLIDAGAARKDVSTQALRSLLFHLDDGGTYVVAQPEADGATVPQRGRGMDVRQLLDRLTRVRADPGLAERERIHADDVNRAAAIESVTRDGSVITVRKTGRHALKLRDTTAERVLPARFGASWGRDLDTRPAVRTEARGSVHANERLESFRTVLASPDLFVREYHDVVCAPRQLVVKDGVILPISFHHGLRKRLQQASPLVRHSDAAFAELDAAVADPPRLPGTYFHFDSEFPGHFGHLLTEDISKLWGWRIAKETHRDLKVLLSAKEPGAPPAPVHLSVLAAWGVPAEDVVCIDAPVRVDTLVGASPMFYNGVYAHPELADIWDRLRDALRPPPAGREPTPRRIFVARAPRSLRPCRNAPELEALFVEHGFVRVRPEQLPFAEQVDLFAGAEMVAGYGGSGLFNCLFSERPGRRIVIASSEYTARNEWTISALKGDDYHHFVCPAEVRRETSAYNSKAFHSAFSFDFARDGATLEALLKT